ncbi:Beta-glucanase precursor [Pseudobythopirellula maris]|uniref:Beta-glucanase n=1 Tax=Pseudobythopirellula maris TaxID=2527991 RepID=A0A5C5ZTU0_9BACT|nr:glycoside hydrolase family 16 protein [Pseudobythopirellula maris]TWT90487.1 Beta-glucanase precursor [Pseudobythopirellula maris]
MNRNRLPASRVIALLGALATAALLASASAAWATAPQQDENLRLLWSDEFDTDGSPDPQHWGCERGFVRNRELQWYQPDNARCEDGVLVIEARRERVPNPGHDPEASSRQRRWAARRSHAEYSSASLTTRGKHAWRYGRLEVKAKIDAQPGMWPAIWTLGESGHWPACGEIDLMEYYRGEILANAAWRGERPRVVWDESRLPIEELGAGWADRFHVWRMDWDAESIRLSVDDRLLNEIRVSDADGGGESGQNPFSQPHYLILNLAVGGTNGGDPSGSRFPSRYSIDYVRVYQQLPAVDR